jgi:hypothetical protein
VAIEAHHTEREVDMLGLYVRALRRHGKPDAPPCVSVVVASENDSTRS